MKFYLAPMEGVTRYVYRNAHFKYFNGVDKYFSPFISPTSTWTFRSKELADIDPEHNKDINLIPQILTNNSADFIRTANELNKIGYNEINLNLGCPSGTVVSKGRGSGFLGDPEKLDRFLDDIFSHCDMKLSIKTRIGVESSDEFEDLLMMYNKYKMEELIIHPRIRRDFYKNHPNMEVFLSAMEVSKNPVCYNGDIFTKSDFDSLLIKVPNLKSIMLGRGVIANPGLINYIKDTECMKIDNMIHFHDDICNGYNEIMSGDRNVLFKMKEIWFYMHHIFKEPEKYWKKIKKTDSLSEYCIFVKELFQEQDIIDSKGYNPNSR